MSNDEYSKRGFPLGSFILKLILVVIFVFLLCWLLPKFMVPAITKSMNGKGCSTSTCDCKGIKALTSQIFANNLDKMKEAAISYYTNERLPQNVGDSKKLTLSDMIGLKIIVPLVDKNGKAVDVEKSYVKITKTNDEYILKVNIKDSEKEDYILVHIGCYNYCESDVCQKKDTNVPLKAGKDNTPYVPLTPEKPVTISCVKYDGKYYNAEGKVVSYDEFKKSCLPEEKHYCVKYNNKYYDNNGKEVSYDDYKKSCEKEEKHYCVKYNNKYYDIDGTEVTYNDYKKSCLPEEKHYCVKYDNKYYDNNGNVVSYNDYKKACLPEELHICVKYDGKYYNVEGKVVSYDDYKTSCETKKDYIYEYKKVTQSKFSEWSVWSAWEKTDCATEEINCNDNEPSCLLKLQRYNRKEKIGTYEKPYAKTREIIRQTGSYQEKSCSKYNYVIINSITYATTTTTKYTQTNVITSQTQSDSNGWKYVGRKLFTNPPRDTETTHYKFAGLDYSYCSDTCTTFPYSYYDIYEYTGSLKTVPNITSTPECSTTTPVNEETIADASCGEYIYKTIPIYSTITVTEKAYRTEPLYGDVCYKSTKKRNLICEGKTQIKWSTYNDTTLLNNGWVYTGTRKEK